MAQSLSTRTELLFSSHLKHPPQGVAFAPGRLLAAGEHLAVHGGPVLGMPLEQGVAVAYAVRPDSRVAVWAINAKAKDHFTQGAADRKGRRWSDLARGACTHAGEVLGRRLPGIDLLVLGDIPAMEGLGSSTALTLAIFRALYAVAEADRSVRDLADDVDLIERTWSRHPPTRTDACLMISGEPGHLTHIEGKSLKRTTYALPKGATLEARITEQRRSLGSTPLTERWGEMRTALKHVRAAGLDVRSLVDIDLGAFDEVADQIPQHARDRAKHIVGECARTRSALEALDAGDTEWLGEIMNAGHESLATLFGASSPEIDAAVEAARQEEGVVGAKLQGGGFGGALAVLRTGA